MALFNNYKEQAVNDATGGSKYSQLADNARQNSNNNYPSNPVNTTTSSKPKIGGKLGQYAQENNLQMYSPSPDSGGSNLKKIDMDAINAQREAEERARQEELRRLEEERRWREEQERLAQEARENAVATANAQVAERRAEQPSSSYMPYGDPRQNTDNPLVSTPRIRGLASELPNPEPETLFPTDYGGTTIEPKAWTPALTPVENPKDSRKGFASKVGAPTQEDEDFYTPMYVPESDETLFPTDYGGTTIPNLPAYGTPMTREQVLDATSSVLNPFINFGVTPAYGDYPGVENNPVFGGSSQPYSTITSVNPNGGINPETGEPYYDTLWDAINGKPIYDNTPITVTNVTEPTVNPLLEEWVNRKYPEYKGQQPEIYGQRNKDANYYRGREYQPEQVIQPIEGNLPTLLDIQANGVPLQELGDNGKPPENNGGLLSRIGNALLSEAIKDENRAKYLVGKGAQSIVNRWNYGQDAQKWVWEQMAGMDFKDDFERQATEDALWEKYDELLASGEIQPSNPLLTSNEVIEKINSIPEKISGALNKTIDQIPATKPEYEEYGQALQIAESEGLEVGSPEYYRRANEIVDSGALSPSQNANPFRSYEAMVRQYDTLNSPLAKAMLMDGIAPDYTRITDYVYNQLPNTMSDLDKINYVRGLTDASGKTHFDVGAATQGFLPDNLSVPYYADYGDGKVITNEAYDNMSAVDYFDADGMTVFRNNDGTYTRGVPQADGTMKYEDVSASEVTPRARYSPQEILSLYVNPRAGEPGESTWRGLDAVFEGLTPEERAGMEELLASFVRGGDLTSDEDRGDLFKLELADMTQDEYDRLLKIFLDKMPALKGLINQGVVTQNDVENFFLKNIPDGSGNGTRTGSDSYSPRSYSYGGYGGYGGYSYYPRSSGSGGYYGSDYNTGRSSRGNATPTTANQRQNRIYNIMKNWSF